MEQQSLVCIFMFRELKEKLLFCQNERGTSCFVCYCLFVVSVGRMAAADLKWKDRLVLLIIMHQLVERFFLWCLWSSAITFVYLSWSAVNSAVKLWHKPMTADLFNYRLSCFWIATNKVYKHNNHSVVDTLARLHHPTTTATVTAAEAAEAAEAADLGQLLAISFPVTKQRVWQDGNNVIFRSKL